MRDNCNTLIMQISELVGDSDIQQAKEVVSYVTHQYQSTQVGPLRMLAFYKG